VVPVILSLLLLMAAPGANQRLQTESRFGRIELRAGTEGFGRELLFRGKVIFECGGDSAEIYRVPHGVNRDHLIVAIHSGGIACPTRFVILDLERSGRHRRSPEFGSCSPVLTAWMRKDAVVAETPVYTPHPDLISAAELKRRNRTKVVYTWRRGKLSRRKAPDRSRGSVRKR
jgi:hypothetical protein